MKHHELTIMVRFEGIIRKWPYDNSIFMLVNYYIIHPDRMLRVSRGGGQGNFTEFSKESIKQGEDYH
jgi:hypothetical protein